VLERANGPDQPVGLATGVAVADHATARHRRKAADMNEEEKVAIDQIANALQVINLLSTRLREGLGESPQHALDLEAATDRAVRAMPAAYAQPAGRSHFDSGSAPIRV